jgi:hypothetical protein
MDGRHAQGNRFSNGSRWARIDDRGIQTMGARVPVVTGDRGRKRGGQARHGWVDAGVAARRGGQARWLDLELEDNRRQEQSGSNDRQCGGGGCRVTRSGVHDEGKA